MAKKTIKQENKQVINNVLLTLGEDNEINERVVTGFFCGLQDYIINNTLDNEVVDKININGNIVSISYKKETI